LLFSLTVIVVRENEGTDTGRGVAS
jgi:hypothetical protein